MPKPAVTTSLRTETLVENKILSTDRGGAAVVGLFFRVIFLVHLLETNSDNQDGVVIGSSRTLQQTLALACSFIYQTEVLAWNDNALGFHRPDLLRW